MRKVQKFLASMEAEKDLFDEVGGPLDIIEAESPDNLEAAVGVIDAESKQTDSLIEMQAEATQDANTMQKVIDVFEDVVDPDAINPATAKAVEITIESICNKYGFTNENYPSVESFADINQRGKSTKLALEEAKGVFAKIGNAIRAFFKMIYDGIMKFVKMVKDFFTNLFSKQKKLEQINEAVPDVPEDIGEITDEQKKKIEEANENIAGEILSLSYSPIENAEDQKAMTDAVKGSTTVKEIAEATVEKLTEMQEKEKASFKEAHAVVNDWAAAVSKGGQEEVAAQAEKVMEYAKKSITTYEVREGDQKRYEKEIENLKKGMKGIDVGSIYSDLFTRKEVSALMARYKPLTGDNHEFFNDLYRLDSNLEKIIKNESVLNGFYSYKEDEYLKNKISGRGYNNTTSEKDVDSAKTVIGTIDEDFDLKNPDSEISEAMKGMSNEVRMEVSKIVGQLKKAAGLYLKYAKAKTDIEASTIKHRKVIVTEVTA